MPKVSKESASQVRDFGLAEDRSEELDGYSVSFVTIREAPTLRGHSPSRDRREVMTLTYQ